VTSFQIFKRAAVVVAMQCAAVVLALGGLDIVNNAPDFVQSTQIACIGWGLFGQAMLLIVAAALLATARGKAQS
jgi:hypothetical protein